MERKLKEKKIKFIYKPAENVPKEERERRLNEAYDILFDKVLKNWKIKKVG